MFYRKIGKRLIDFSVSFLGLVFLLPVFIVIGIFIKLDSRGPIIFKHKRLGKNCQPIYVFKFRSMINNAILLGPEYTTNNDLRITKIGYILRKTSLDELPQLLNVFKGEMSLIGPRPDAYTEYPTNFQKERTMILPGITGLAQTNGRSLLTKIEKENYDLEYVKKYSFIKDLQIIFKTIKIVFKQEGTN